jgi:hypothetical protein
VDDAVENSVQNNEQRWTTRGRAVNPPVDRRWMPLAIGGLTCEDAHPPAVEENFPGRNLVG